MIVAGICRKHGYWRGERCGKCDKEAQSAFYVPKFTETEEMKAKGYKYHAEFFPEESRIYDTLHARRKLDKPIDGNCFKDAGQALKELKSKRNRGG